MRPKKVIALAVPDEYTRLQHELRLSVWGYRCILAAEVGADHVDTLLIDGGTAEAARALAFDHPSWPVVFVAHSLNTSAMQAACGGTAVHQPEFALGLRRALHNACKRKRGPKPPASVTAKYITRTLAPSDAVTYAA